MTGPELKQLRQDLSDALGQALTATDMARLCGLEPKAGADTIRRWEVTGPSGPAGKLLGILAMASDRHPILDNFNTFDRWDVHERERPALREAFREKMRNEIRQRLAHEERGGGNGRRDQSIQTIVLKFACKATVQHKRAGEGIGHPQQAS